MTRAQTGTSAGQRVSPFAAGVVVPIAAVTAVLHCIASAFGDGYWFDEVYVLAIGPLILSVSIVRSDVGERIAQRTADAYRALPQAQRERTAGTFPRRPPATTRCYKPDAIPVPCARTSQTCERSVMSATTCMRTC